MSRLLKEPLLHFLLLGAALFAADALLREPPAGSAPGEIVVTAGQVETMVALFVKTRGRAPTREELYGLVDEHVLEEAMYREGVALGVDQDDVVVRRRVRQKMEFLVEDLIDLAEPTEEDLRAWHEAHADDYAGPARLSLRQVFLSGTGRGDALQADAAALLARLREVGPEAELDGLGDPMLFAGAYADATMRELEADFGPEYAAGLAGLPVGTWGGPLESPYGLHLVLVEARVAGESPPFEELRDAVLRDWRYAQQEAAAQQYYEELVGRFEVTVQWPEVEDARSGTEAAGEGAR